MRFGRPEKKGRAQRTRVKPEATPAPPRKPRPLQAGATVTQESQVEFDPVEGHNHDGVGSLAISHNDLDPASITADQHHTKQHNLWDDQHHADVSGTPADGDLVFRNSTWQRLAIGASNAVLRVVSGLPSWQGFGHTLLGSDHSDTTGSPATGDLLYRNSSSQWTKLAIGASNAVLRVVSGLPSWQSFGHPLLGSDHSDTTGNPESGDILYRNASSQWTKLAIGSSGGFLRVVSSLPAWSTAAFSDLLGALGVGQHGALGDGDHTGDLTGNARVGVRKNSAGSTFKRRRINLIEGPGVSLTVADDAGGEEVDVTISASGVGGGGSPDNAQYVVGASNGTLTNELVLGADVVMKGTLALLPAAAIAGRLYVATDDDGGTLYRDTGTAWEKAAPGVSEAPQSHALDGALHTVSGKTAGQLLVATGANTFAFEAPGARVFQAGLSADRPTAPPDGTLYFATDTYAGLLARYDGGGLGWTRCAAGVVGAGDVTGDLSVNNVVGRIQGKNVPSPSAGDDLKCLAYDHAGAQYGWWSREFPVSGWGRQNIQNVGAAAEMPRVGGGGGTNIPAPWIPHRAGYLTGVSVGLDEGIGGSGTRSYTVEIYKNGVATGISATITGSAGTEKKKSTVAGSPVAFAAEDELTIYDARSGTVAARGSQAQLFAVWSE